MRTPLETLYNFHWIVPGEASRSAQIPAAVLGALLRSKKIRSVINLRGEQLDQRWWNRERRVCDSLGVEHFDASLDSRSLPTRAMLAALFDAFDSAPRPFLVKCSGGQDRTSLAAALYILQREGFSARDKADTQFRRLPYLHFPRKHQRWLRLFPHYAEGQAKGRPLGEWVREAYDPHAFAQWLSQSQKASYFKDVYVRPRDRVKNASRTG